MAIQNAGRRSWFYHFVRAIALVEMVHFAAILVDLALHPVAPTLAGDSAILRLINALVAATLILVVGVLVVRRTRGNLIGWLLVLWAAIIGAGSARADAFWGFAAELNLFPNSLWPVLWAIPLHFPDGKPYPRRMGWVVQGVVAASIVLIFLTSLGTPFMDSSVRMRTNTPNQFYVPFLNPLTAVADIEGAIPILSLMALLLISVTLRYRASRGRERQQLKYMVGAALLLILIAVIGNSLGIFDARQSTLGDWHAVLAYALSFALPLIPVAGIALPILRHQLYDIDIIIRRTVIYTFLTALLLATYFGGVVVLQQVFVALTGQRSELAIILSTLAIAALFVPLRSGIQSVIDRRFFRRKYDAQKVLEAFTLIARDEVDPQLLAAKLLDAADATLQPTHMALWLPHTDRVTSRTSQ